MVYYTNYPDVCKVNGGFLWRVGRYSLRMMRARSIPPLLQGQGDQLSSDN